MTTTITKNGDTINGIQVGDIFKVTIVIQKNAEGVYSLVSQSISVFSKGEKNANYTFKIPDKMPEIDEDFGIKSTDVEDFIPNNGEFSASPDKFGGGGIHSNHIYQLPKTPKRKIRQISKKTLRKKQQLTTSH